MVDFRFFLYILVIGPHLLLAMNDGNNVFDQNHNLPNDNKEEQVGRNGKGNPYSCLVLSAVAMKSKLLFLK